MRKYQRLILVVLSLASLCLFLIYREQYNRLHYILEVFDFFGQPCNLSELRNADSIYNNHEWGPIPIWYHNEDVLIYSAFWNDQHEAKAIVVQPGANPVKSCYLWFENSEKPVVGKYSYSNIAEQEDKTPLYFYICNGSGEGDPYGVTFRVKGKGGGVMYKVPLTNNLRRVNQTLYDLTVCVSPSTYNKRKLAEFLSYYKLLGVNSFIFYGGEIPHSVSKVISIMSQKLGFNVTFFPWNYPLSDNKKVAYEVVKNDCIYRNKNNSKHVIVVELDEYIVPSGSLNDILEDFHPQSQMYGLPVQIFCIKKRNKFLPIAVQNVHFIHNLKNKQTNFIYRVTNEDVVSIQQVDRSYASIHKFVPCTEEPEVTKRDDGIEKYSTDLTRSTLVQMIINNQL